MTAHIGNDYVRVRIGIGHPGAKELVKNWVLQNFVKSDHEWLEPLLGAIAKAAPELADGANDKFQSFVAHAMQTEARLPRAAEPAAQAQGAERRDDKPRARGPLRQASPLVRRIMSTVMPRRRASSTVAQTASGYWIAGQPGDDNNK